MKKYVFESLKFFCAAILCTILSAFATPSHAALPDGYTQLEYIESTGTQYIDTGYTPTTAGYSANVKFMLTGDTLNNQTIIGFNTVLSDVRERMSFGLNGTARVVFGYGNGSTEYSNDGSGVIQLNRLTEINVNFVTSASLRINGTEYFSTSTFTRANSTSVYLMKVNGSEQSSTGRWYSAQIYNQNNELVRNFVPAKDSSGVIGMYDTVNNRFYENAGSGSFIAGPTVSTIGQCDFDIANIYKVGTPTITNAGIYTTNSSESYIRTRNDVAFATANTWSFKWRFTYHPANSDQGIMSGDGGTNVQAIINSAGRPRFSFGNDTSWNAGIWNDASLTFAYQDGVTYDNEIYFDGTRYGFKVNGTEIGGVDNTTKAANTYFAIGVERGRTSAQYSRAEWDLTHTSLTLDGVEQLPWCGGSMIKIATTKYNETAFSPLNTALANAISVVDTVVSNTITQAASIATLQAQKQTRPADDTCPAYKQCLLVEDENGTPHWYEITDPFRDFVAPIIANNVNGSSRNSSPGVPSAYTQLEYIKSTGTQWIDTGIIAKQPFDTRLGVSFADNNKRYLFGISNNSPGYCGRRENGRFEMNNIFTSMLGKKDEKYELHYYTTSNGTFFEIKGPDNETETLEVGTIASAADSTISWKIMNNMDAYTLNGNIYYAQISQSGNLLFNGIPAQRNSDGAIGMYDTVSGEFFENKGTGSFIAGPVVPNSPSSWSVSWAADANKGISAGTVSGTSACNSISGAALEIATDTQTSSANWNAGGVDCWCQVTGVENDGEYTSIETSWIFDSVRSSALNCDTTCARSCSGSVMNTATYRKKLFGM